VIIDAPVTTLDPMMFADTDAVADAVDPAVLASGITQIEPHSVGDRRTNEFPKCNG
jgi:hypothetical protein